MGAKSCPHLYIAFWLKWFHWGGGGRFSEPLSCTRPCLCHCLMSLHCGKLMLKNQYGCKQMGEWESWFMAGCKVVKTAAMDTSINGIFFLPPGQKVKNMGRQIIAASDILDTPWNWLCGAFSGSARASKYSGMCEKFLVDWANCKIVDTY